MRHGGAKVKRGNAEAKGEDEGLSAEARQSARKLCERRKLVDHSLSTRGIWGMRGVTSGEAIGDGVTFCG